MKVDLEDLDLVKTPLLLRMWVLKAYTWESTDILVGRQWCNSLYAPVTLSAVPDHAKHESRVKTLDNTPVAVITLCIRVPEVACTLMQADLTMASHVISTFQQVSTCLSDLLGCYNSSGANCSTLQETIQHIASQTQPLWTMWQQVF